MMRTFGIALTALAFLGLSATIATAKSKPKPPPAPKAPVYVAPPPPRPTPPNFAPTTFVTPPTLPNGMHQTVNTGVSSDQVTWNFRSALNVAALNCNQPQWAGMIPAYRAFLKKHRLGLAAANRAVDAEYRGKYGPRFISKRETYSTSVYNFYAYPPTLPQFCEAALATTAEVSTIKLTELRAFAGRTLPKLDAVMENFYRNYEQWQRDAAAWDARYAGVLVPAAGPR